MDEELHATRRVGTAEHATTGASESGAKNGGGYMPVHADADAFCGTMAFRIGQRAVPAYSDATYCDQTSVGRPGLSGT